MTNPWILTGFAALMAACVVLVLVLAVAVVASRYAAQRTDAREATADAHGLPTVPAAVPAERPVRSAEPDLNQLRAIALEGADR